MAIRHIIFAAFMASACAAHADVIPAGSSGVLGAGVMSGNLGLIGGVAYGTGATQASSAIGAAGQGALFSSNGIEGMYLLGSGHGILAANFGALSTTAPTAPAAAMTAAGAIPVTAMGGASGGVSGGISAGGSASGSVVVDATSASTASHGSMGVQVLAPRAAAPLPEPSTTALMLLGLVGAGALTRRRIR